MKRSQVRRQRQNLRNLSIGIGLISLVSLFFFLFAPISTVRYLSLFFLGILLVNFAYDFLIPRFIRVDRREKIIRGIKLQSMEMGIYVKNLSPIPISYFQLDDGTGGLFAENHSFLVNLGPFQTRLITYEAKGHQRGEYEIGPLRIKGTDPMGFFAWTKRIETRTRAIVYPSIFPMELLNNQGLPAGNINVINRMYEDVTQFRSLREYIPGDDMKRINWKASAKTNKLFTMEFDSTLYFPVLLVLNFCADDYPTRLRTGLLERSAEVAASIAFYFADLKQEIGFVSNGTTTEAGAPNQSNTGGGSRSGSAGAAHPPPIVVQGKSGYEHAQGILEIIAKLKAIGGRADFNTLLSQSGNSISMGTRVMVVTPRVSESQASSLIAARRKGLNLQVMQIESTTDRRDEDHIKGALRVIAVREMGQETIHE